MPLQYNKQAIKQAGKIVTQAWNVLQHKAERASPWKARSPPMPGPAAGPSQMPNSEDVDDAMAAAGNLVCQSIWCRRNPSETLLQPCSRIL